MNNSDYELYKGIHKRFYGTAKQLLIEDGQICPMIIMQCSTQIYIIPMTAQSEETKLQFLSIVKGAAKRLKAEMVITIHEAWTSELITTDEENAAIEKGEPIEFTMPSKDPDRGEELIASIWINGKGGTMLRGEMIRGEENKLVGVRDKPFNVADLGVIEKQSLFYGMCGEEYPDDHPCMSVPKKQMQEMLDTVIHSQNIADADLLKKYKGRFKRTLH